MKRCAYCECDNPDDAVACADCRSTEFASVAIQVKAEHKISDAEGRFWNTATLRELAIFILRLQALVFFFDAALDLTSLGPYIPIILNSSSSAELFRRTGSGMYLIIFRAAFHMLAGFLIIIYSAPLLTWMTKDLVQQHSPRRPPPNSQ